MFFTKTHHLVHCLNLFLFSSAFLVDQTFVGITRWSCGALIALRLILVYTWHFSSARPWRPKSGWSWLVYMYTCLMFRPCGPSIFQIPKTHPPWRISGRSYRGGVTLNLSHKLLPLKGTPFLSFSFVSGEGHVVFLFFPFLIWPRGFWLRLFPFTMVCDLLVQPIRSDVVQHGHFTNLCSNCDGLPL